MTKEELRQYIQKMNLEVELEELLLELVDGSEEVNQALLNAIVDVLNMSADFHERAAEVFEEEAATYEELSEEVNLLDEEATRDRIEAFKQTQEQLLKELNDKVQEVTKSDTSTSLDKARENLQTAVTPTS